MKNLNCKLMKRSNLEELNILKKCFSTAIPTLTSLKNNFDEQSSNKLLVKTSSNKFKKSSSMSPSTRQKKTIVKSSLEVHQWIKSNKVCWNYNLNNYSTIALHCNMLHSMFFNFFYYCLFVYIYDYYHFFFVHFYK